MSWRPFRKVVLPKVLEVGDSWVDVLEVGDSWVYVLEVVTVVFCVLEVGDSWVCVGLFLMRNWRRIRWKCDGVGMLCARFILMS